MTDVKKQVESLLFSSGKVMKEEDLSELIGVSKSDIRKALNSLKEDYDQRDTSLTLMDSADGWKLNVREQYVNLVTKIVADTELPFPVLETLSIVAYKAPVMQADVIKARGTNAYDHIQILIDGGFIERKKKGRSFEVVLTHKFFEYFDVEGDAKLKTIFQDVKPSEPAPRRSGRKRLGELPVVDIPEEQKTLAQPGEEGAQLLGDLKVVDVAPPKDENRLTADSNEPDNSYLDDIDARIKALSDKNDTNDSDESFKRMNSDEQPAEVGEPAAVDEGATPGDKESDDAEPDKPKAEDKEEKEAPNPSDPLAEKDEDKLEI
ncbi:SMC-Scp complex subunit ScpB [Candidatus Woesearchaeota archaeon]|nr:SMC-Scp complex subunit ScpB [Candidatus Woesearchaeota archaeon]